MNTKMKKIFNQVQAEEELKDSTKIFLAQKTEIFARRRRVKQCSIYAAAFACVLFVIIGTGRLYFTVTAQISIDINPSLELGVNRFNRIVSVKGFNDDGQKIVNTFDIKNMNYADAVNKIMEDDNISSLLSDNEIMTITVAGGDRAQSDKILLKMEACTAGHGNTYCYPASAEEAAEAHKMGLSCGRYRAFLELKNIQPDITPEEVQRMTMREVWEMLDKLQGDGELETSSYNNKGHGHHDTAGSHRKKHGNIRKEHGGY